MCIYWAGLEGLLGSLCTQIRQGLCIPSKASWAQGSLCEGSRAGNDTGQGKTGHRHRAQLSRGLEGTGLSRGLEGTGLSRGLEGTQGTEGTEDSSIFEGAKRGAAVTNFMPSPASVYGKLRIFQKDVCLRQTLT